MAIKLKVSIKGTLWIFNKEDKEEVCTIVTLISVSTIVKLTLFFKDVRMSPINFQQPSPHFYHQGSEDSMKSESPSRKRRRLSRSGHHIELNTQPSSPPRRSPRQHQPTGSHHPMQVRGLIH